MKLEKFNYSNGSKKKYFLYGFIMCAVLMILLNIITSHAKYKVTESIKIAEGKISYKPYDFKIMAMYQKNDQGEYVEIKNRMPSNGYIINEEKSYCTLDNVNKDTQAILKTVDGIHSISNLAYNDKCYLYFDKQIFAKEQILANMPTKTTRDNFNVLTIDTPGTIYKAEDNDGDSYYFAGISSDNYVKFANKWWRIIRINGDGTIRLIYQGDSATSNGQIGISAFNTLYNNNMYVGYMYENGVIHGLETNSTIKEALDKWYDNNLTNYGTYIDTNAGFCGDREPSTITSDSNGSGGIGTITTYYGGYIRFVTGGNWQSNPTPTLKCKNSNDLYTKTNSNKGNKKLTKPIGLISVDEVGFAGGSGVSENNSYYLYTSQNYWTMSPYIFYSSDSYAYVFRINEKGSIYVNYVNYEYGTRPVINLKATTMFTSGKGTVSDPYIVAGTE